MARGVREAYFDRAAASWGGRVPQCGSVPVFRRWFRHVHLQPGQTVIDVGCGSGRLLPYIWRRIRPQGALYAADISRKMILEAKRRHPGIPVRYLKASAVRLPLPDRTCDAVIALNTFAHIHHKASALKEFHRILRSAGRLWIVHLAGRHRLAEIHRRAGGAIQHDRIPGPVRMRQMMHQAGFVRVSLQDEEDLFVASGRRRGRKN